jgi:gluconolactonase
LLLVTSARRRGAMFCSAIGGLGLIAGCGVSPSAAAAVGGAHALPTAPAGTASVSAGGTAGTSQTPQPPQTADAGARAPVAGTRAAGAGGSGARAAEAIARTIAAHGGAGAAGLTGAGAAGAADGGAAGVRCPAGPFQAPVPANVSVTRVEGMPPLDTFNDNGNMRTNIEGPVWIAGKLYVSEFPFTPAPQSRILALDPATGNVSVALAPAASNGLAVEASGALVATDHGTGAIVRMQFPLSMPQTLVSTYDGKRFNSPNDLAVASDGTIYFSDPDYQAPLSHPQAKTRVYRLAPGAQEATLIDDARSQPNGVTLSVDERTLYVAGSDGIFRYPVSSGGEVSASARMRINAFGGGSDGMGMDCAGNLYASAGQRVVVLDPSGVEIGSIAVPQAESVTNVAFGGPEHRTLFITSMGSGTQRGVFRAELNVPGLPY